MKNLRLITLTCLLSGAIMAQAQNLFRNASFEDVPNGNIGQGFMPSEWFAVSGSPDTYSNDGSYGLPPGGFNNFTGILAQDGMRWVAGGSNSPESFAQTLTAPLVPTVSYTIGGWLHHPVRADLNTPGGYRISLRNSNQTAVQDIGILGFTASTAEGWIFRTFTFEAPTDSATLSLIRFDPIVPVGSTEVSYPGLDNLTLSPVPEPMTVLALAAGVGALLIRRRNRL